MPHQLAQQSDTNCGYRQSLDKEHIPYHAELVLTGNWELQSGLAAVRALLQLPEKPSTIFAANDLMALGAIYGIQEIGLRVPEDIAVVGYDDREIAALTRPTITTVSLPCYEMGLTSAKMLLSLLDQPDRNSKADTVAIKGELMVRESSGALKGAMLLDQYRTQTTPRRLMAEADDTQQRE